MRASITLLFALCTTAIAASHDHPQWGTFRPHALISARAAVPHSPYFGFVYHPADSLSIRHLSGENHDDIKSFSWSRHDGTFGDQTIEDETANLRLSTHFLAHPSKPSACVLRVSAALLDSAKPAKPTSLVFYAVAAPEDITPYNSTLDDSAQWGTLRFDERTVRTHSSPEADVRILGDAKSIGGAYSFRVYSPRQDIEIVPADGLFEDQEKLSSRSRLRSSFERPPENEAVHSFRISSSQIPVESAWNVEDNLRSMLLRTGNLDENRAAMHILEESMAETASGVFVQRIVRAPFEIDATFVLNEGRESDEVRNIEDDLSGLSLDEHLKRARESFDEKFDTIFKLSEKQISSAEEKFAKAALSNVMGGIGFFFGSSVVKRKSGKSHGDGSVDRLPPVGLLTATPSRATFPRGFLWDEGFHQLIIQRWDPSFSQKCMQSWFGAIQENGWIPREQILGLEARMRFPRHVQHLMIQNPLIANPPTILMPLRVLSFIIAHNRKNSSFSSRDECKEQPDDDGICNQTSEYLSTSSRQMLSSVMQYYEWLKRSQAGSLQHSFRWRGRSSKLRTPEGYPLTLASGLDDYPRAETPSDRERHLDLHCWMVWASGVLAQLTEGAGKDATPIWEEYNLLKNKLIEHHGSPGSQVGNGREDLLLCDFDGEEKICHEGYVTILPLILGLLHSSDPRVLTILESLESSEILRARAGVRSLSKRDIWHRKGDDYWTGSVWMPFNFLTLAALKTKYSVEEGPYQNRAKQLYDDLRQSILRNSFRVFSQTGQLWENYSPEEDGSGKSGRQFTGWSALIVLIYAEIFDGVV